MPAFTAPDGTTLAYRVLGGDGPPLVCLPGGPMRDSVYLGELGGLSAHRRLIMLDLRGTGRSEVPADTGSYRCDRQVEDVEALRAHLGLDRMDLLGHSAGANLAALYAGRHPERVGALVLLTPSVMGVGITIPGEDRLETARLRRGEPWYPDAYAALEALVCGQGTADSRRAIAPFLHGRWDDAARAYDAADEAQKNAGATAAYAAEGAFDPDATRTALAGFDAPVLVLAGELDVSLPRSAAAEYAALFPHARLVVQPGAGHAPWLDDPDRFTGATAAFLATAEAPNPA
ncbi:alpha/beta hydrolase [Streptomyces sp. WM6372]|uniref:alpha/beta fold hydrolase n=1 Tax=Streptomyces sp. WM6372 TaxID=1415555 RepID=UPI0006AE0723|nr:alpha/beta hydrolase [Streptomyces sp. WM6372]KOU15848.1 alpha/beta hydrolase [Streptomyces sp. WM6372]